MDQVFILGKYRPLLLNLAASVARRNDCISFDDLMQEGSLALLEAWRVRDGRPGFTTFARYRIRAALRGHVRAFQYPVKVSEGSYVRGTNMPQTVALDAPLTDSEGEASTCAEQLPAPEPELMLCAMPDLMARVNRALADLSPCEQHVLHGLYIREAKFRELSAELGITITAIWKAEKRALSKLRNHPALKRC